MKSFEFEIGKRYAVTVPNFYLNGGITEVGHEFTCHAVDSDGDCWSMDILFRGEECMDGEGWCAARPEHLKDGRVVVCGGDA